MTYYVIRTRHQRTMYREICEAIDAALIEGHDMKELSDRALACRDRAKSDDAKFRLHHLADEAYVLYVSITGGSKP